MTTEWLFHWDTSNQGAELFLQSIQKHHNWHSPLKGKHPHFLQVTAKMTFVKSISCPHTMVSINLALPRVRSISVLTFINHRDSATSIQLWQSTSHIISLIQLASNINLEPIYTIFYYLITFHLHFLVTHNRQSCRCKSYVNCSFQLFCNQGNHALLG